MVTLVGLVFGTAALISFAESTVVMVHQGTETAHEQTTRLRSRGHTDRIAMTALTSYVDADLEVSLVPSSLHTIGTGVDELGDLVLNTRDITRIEELAGDGLLGWWAGVAGYFADLSTSDEGGLLQSFTLLALPAATQVQLDAETRLALSVVSDPADVPAIDVLIHPDAVSQILTTTPQCP